MTVVGMPGRGLGGARRIFVRLRTVPAVRPWAARKAHEQHQVRHKASSRLQAHHRATTLHGKLVNPACQPESPALWRYPAAPVVPEVLGSCHRPDRRRGRKECLGIGNARGPILWEHQFQGGVESSAAPVRTLLTYIEHARAKNRTEGVVYRHWYHVQGMWQDRVHVNLSLASCADFHVVQCQLMSRQVELGKSRTLIEMQRMLSRCIAARLLHRKKPAGMWITIPDRRLHQERRHDTSAAYQLSAVEKTTRICTENTDSRCLPLTILDSRKTTGLCVPELATGVSTRLTHKDNRPRQFGMQTLHVR